jgi:hypothetical protein
MAKVPPCDLFGRVEETARSTEQETRAAHSQSLITATKKRGLPPRDRPHKAARVALVGALGMKGIAGDFVTCLEVHFYKG